MKQSLSKLTDYINSGLGRFWLFLIPLIYFIRVHKKRVDFPCYHIAGGRYFHAENLYFMTDTWPYKYPPVVAFFFQPLAIFPLGVAKVIFYVLAFVAMAATYKLILDLLFGDEPIEKKYTIIPFFLVLRFHFYDYANLQVNSIMLFLLVYGFVLLRKNKIFKGAMLFAIGGTFKIIPIFISFYYLLKGEFKKFFAIVGSFVALQLIPLLTYGFSGYKELLKNYSSLMGQSHSFYSTDRILQSATSLIARTTEYLNILTGETERHLILAVLLLVGVVPFLLMILKKLSSKESSLIELSYCLLFYPLVNPVGWRHAHVFILPAVVTLFYYIYKEKLFKRFAYKILIGLYFLFNVISSKFLVGSKFSHIGDYLSFNVLGIYVLFAGLFLIHGRLTTESKD
ncbi:glycosyltransferase family 87 protein [Bacteriovorax sp. Seq25_V]|uniref:glycosyltransferase family 87 protein n=1 Tax=Bacteriovorax sp. Seq25_V TaxID=1201288 RepID=UPI00038A0B56|nr:glycosyltransferase family 87 protein [Bacteriovorax sp. Seq25_V]EQC43455.1 PF09594 family protein [Bacteriovorax sp. Seq25_V]